MCALPADGGDSELLSDITNRVFMFTDWLCDCRETWSFHQESPGILSIGSPGKLWKLDTNLCFLCLYFLLIFGKPESAGSESVPLTGFLSFWKRKNDWKKRQKGSMLQGKDSCWRCLVKGPVLLGCRARAITVWTSAQRDKAIHWTSFAFQGFPPSVVYAICI